MYLRNDHTLYIIPFQEVVKLLAILVVTVELNVGELLGQDFGGLE